MSTKQSGRKSTGKVARDFLARVPSACLFPIMSARKAPPLFKNELELASNEPKRVAQWSANYLTANWGLATKKSGLIVMDVDTKPGKVGSGTLFDLEMEHGDLPRTLTVESPSGGKHFYFAASPDMLKRKSAAFGQDIDAPNYVLIPGCVLDGVGKNVVAGAYKIIVDAPIAPAPAWFLQYLDAKEAERVEQIPEVEQDTDAIRQRCSDYLTNDSPLAIEGQGGDATTLQVFGVLKDMGASEPMAVELAADLWNDRCEPPWTIEDLTTKARNAYAYLTENAPGSATPEADFGDDPADTTSIDPESIAEGERQRAAEKAMADRPAERRYTIPELCNDWVWLAPSKRFVNRTNPDYILDKEAFNDRFQYLKGEFSTLTKRLFGRTERTIPKLMGAVYRPNVGEFTDDGFWNGWRPSPIKSSPGDTKLFHAHIAYLFPNESDQKLLLDWMAAVLQNPATKPRHQLFTHGRIQRTGKTFFARLMRELLGRVNVQMLTQDILENGFTGWAMRTKLVWIEEVRDLTGSKKATSKLHSWASESTMTINQKNLPTFVMDQSIAFMIFSNKLDALALDNSDGRYLVLRTDVGVHPLGAPYYSALYGDNGVGGILGDPVALGAILHELLNRPLGKYSIEQAAPNTAAKRDMIEEGEAPQLQWMKAHDGEAPMRYTVKDPDEVVEAMPRRLQNQYAAKAVREGLRDHFGGVPWQYQIRPDGRSGDKLRVWLTGELAARALSGKLTSAQVLTAYRAERSKTNSEAASTAADDFPDAAE